MSTEDKDAKAVATPKDALLFQVILCSMKNKPDVDWSTVAARTGYKDGKTASTRYGQIMKKLTGVSAGKAMSGINATLTSTSNPGTPTKAAKKVATAPVKRGVKTPKEVAVKKRKVVEDEGEEDGMDGGRERKVVKIEGAGERESEPDVFFEVEESAEA